jgi:hypothetical protein
MNIKTHKINLDLPECVRWNNLIDDYKKELQDAVKEIDNIFKAMKVNKTFTLALGRFLIGAYSTFSTILYEEELKAIAKRANISFTKLLLMQLCYEWSAMCTSVVTKVKGRNVHYRTMDWEMEFLKKLTVEVEFYKEGKLLYKAISWAGCVGVMTGVSPGQYSIALNFRISDKTFMHNLRRVLDGKWPVSYAIRHVLENNYDFGGAFSFLMKCQLVSPCYLTLCNANSNWDSYVITRDPERVIKVDGSNDYLIQTNKDNQLTSNGDNILMSSQRYGFVESKIKGAENDWKSMGELIKALNIFPIINDITIYLAIMDPETGYIYSDIIE